MTCHKNRQVALQVLRNNFGNQAFDSEEKLQMLCDSNSEVHSGSILYSYDDRVILETLDYIKTNIALEMLAQLKVRSISN